jgi:hypothetical protein
VSTPRFEIRPLGLWARPVTNPRAGSGRFRASWDDTIDLLINEVEKLDGSLIVVQVDADPSELRRDGMLRARAAVRFPGVKVSFESKHGPLTYATDAYDRNWGGDPPGWQANVRAIALSLQALRAVDRYGATSTGEQYRGWTAIGAKAAETSLTIDEAVRVLADAAGARREFVQGFADILVDAGTPGRIVADESVAEACEAIGRLYKIAAKTAHPDRGGNGDVFRLITAARDVLLDGH